MLLILLHLLSSYAWLVTTVYVSVSYFLSDYSNILRFVKKVQTLDIQTVTSCNELQLGPLLSSPNN